MVEQVKGRRSKTSTSGKFIVQRLKGSLEDRQSVETTLCMEAGPELFFCNVDGRSIKA